MKKTILSIALFTLALSFSGGVQTSYAADTVAPVSTVNNAQYTLLTPLPCVPTDGPGCENGLKKSVTIQEYVLYVFKLAIAVAVFLAVVMVTFAGFKYMTEESISGKGKAREMIQDAAFGLLGALGSWLILYTINPQLVDLSLITAPKLNLVAQPNQLSKSSFDDLLSAQNALLKQNTSNIINQNTAAATSQQLAQSNIESLEASLRDNNCSDDEGNRIGVGDTTCDNLWNQYQVSNDALDLAVSQQNTFKAVASIASAQSAFEATTYNYKCPGCGASELVGNTNIDDAKKAIQSIDFTYQQAYSKISNSDAASKALLTSQRTYSEASIVNDYNTNVALKKLAESPGTTQVTPATTEATALIQQLQSYSIPNQTTSNGIITQPVGTLTNHPELLVSYQQLNDAKIKALQDAIAKAKTTDAAYRKTAK